MFRQLVEATVCLSISLSPGFSWAQENRGSVFVCIADELFRYGSSCWEECHCLKKVFFDFNPRVKPGGEYCESHKVGDNRYVSFSSTSSGFAAIEVRMSIDDFSRCPTSQDQGTEQRGASVTQSCPAELRAMQSINSADAPSGIHRPHDVDNTKDCALSADRAGPAAVFEGVQVDHLLAELKSWASTDPYDPFIYPPDEVPSPILLQPKKVAFVSTNCFNKWQMIGTEHERSIGVCVFSESHGNRALLEFWAGVFELK